MGQPFKTLMHRQLSFMLPPCQSALILQQQYQERHLCFLNQVKLSGAIKICGFAEFVRLLAYWRTASASMPSAVQLVKFTREQQLYVYLRVTKPTKCTLVSKCTLFHACYKEKNNNKLERQPSKTEIFQRLCSQNTSPFPSVPTTQRFWIGPSSTSQCFSPLMLHPLMS